MWLGKKFNCSKSKRRKKGCMATSIFLLFRANSQQKILLCSQPHEKLRDLANNSNKTCGNLVRGCDNNNIFYCALQKKMWPLTAHPINFRIQGIYLSFSNITEQFITTIFFKYQMSNQNLGKISYLAFNVPDVSCDMFLSKHVK